MHWFPSSQVKIFSLCSENFHILTLKTQNFEVQIEFQFTETFQAVEGYISEFMAHMRFLIHIKMFFVLNFFLLPNLIILIHMFIILHL